MIRLSRLSAASTAIIGITLMGLAVPSGAWAATTPSSSDATESVLVDPGARYVTLEEAEQLYGVTEDEIVSDTPEVQSDVVSPMSSWGGCDYEGVGDYPHVTRNQASVHGYWVKTGGTCPGTAKVTVDLQALLCGMGGCSWVTQNTDSGTFQPGSGTGRWATPHKTCANTNSVGWRGEIDVDLTNWADPYGKHYSPAKNLNCSPA